MFSLLFLAAAQPENDQKMRFGAATKITAYAYTEAGQGLLT
jgi:hypothetical protein